LQEEVQQECHHLTTLSQKCILQSFSVAVSKYGDRMGEENFNVLVLEILNRIIMVLMRAKNI
jgi:hypothetical protein